ncbi:hypothetical protein CAPTEDRAFT_194156 [Capitella teleta]|uniref:Uncharacterized protein n=1 Tax=Capitella teleta TaxID=283909 RepID=R7TNT6_CAPTE|nr:hypothetical protein CAPTEDRAFT_194156 [Capitella teleta]|eukprot:ELT95212.1 hypothetical protein CAPTEDRAFT_194156 [Capitella teleta]
MAESDKRKSRKSYCRLYKAARREVAGFSVEDSLTHSSSEDELSEDDIYQPNYPVSFIRVFQMGFHIVEFIDEETVEVVPESWITSRNGVLYCWWPVHGQKMKAKKSEEPKDTWLDFKVRLLSARPGKRKKQLRMKTCSMGCSGGLIRDIIIGGAEPSEAINRRSDIKFSLAEF